MLQSVRQFGYPEGLECQPKEQRKEASDEALAAWLAEDVCVDVLKITQAGRRAPEDVLGTMSYSIHGRCNGSGPRVPSHGQSQYAHLRLFYGAFPLEHARTM